jgi:hypothetical protein
MGGPAPLIEDEAVEVPTPEAATAPEVNFSCPNCQAPCTHSVPGEIIFCQRCGQKLEVPMPLLEQTLQGEWQPVKGAQIALAIDTEPPTALPTHQPHCPRCQSSKIIKVPLAYERETFHSESVGIFTGVGIGRQGAGLLLGNTKQSGFQQSQLGIRLQPPQKARQSSGPEWALAGMIILGLLALGNFAQMVDIRKLGSSLAAGFVLTVGAIACGWGYVQGQKRRRELDIWNREEYRRLFAEWRASWLCEKCGTVFFYRSEVDREDENEP